VVVDDKGNDFFKPDDGTTISLSKTRLNDGP